MTELKKSSRRNVKRTNTTKWINIVVVIGVGFLIIFGFVDRRNKLKKSDFTTCIIVNFGHASGGSGSRPEVVIYEYRVDGKLYKTASSFPHDNSVKVGNCYKVKYSIEDPRVNEVLFDDGIINFDK